MNIISPLEVFVRFRFGLGVHGFVEKTLCKNFVHRIILVAQILIAVYESKISRPHIIVFKQRYANVRAAAVGQFRIISARGRNNKSIFGTNKRFITDNVHHNAAVPVEIDIGRRVERAVLIKTVAHAEHCFVAHFKHGHKLVVDGARSQTENERAIFPAVKHHGFGFLIERQRPVVRSSAIVINQIAVFFYDQGNVAADGVGNGHVTVRADNAFALVQDVCSLRLSIEISIRFGFGINDTAKYNLIARILKYERVVSSVEFAFNIFYVRTAKINFVIALGVFHNEYIVGRLSDCVGIAFAPNSVKHGRTRDRQFVALEIFGFTLRLVRPTDKAVARSGIQTLRDDVLLVVAP